jgi:transcription antitermination factor NusA-like protein
MWTIGHLVVGRVLKSLPEYNAYLVWVEEQRDWGVLPKQYADRTYCIRDLVTAAIYKEGDRYPILSQRSACYFRRIAESVFEPVIRDAGVQVRRVASVEHASFVKIAISGVDGAGAAIKLCLPYVRTFQERTKMTASLVGHATPLEEFIKQALAPAPIRAIRRVELFREEQRARVIVEHGTISQFLGRGGVNAAAASKLTGVRVEPMDEQELQSTSIQH